MVATCWKRLLYRSWKRRSNESNDGYATQHANARSLGISLFAVNIHRNCQAGWILQVSSAIFVPRPAMMRPPQMNPQQVMQLVMRLRGRYEGKRVSYDWWRCQQPFCLRAPPMNQVSAPVAGQNMFIHCVLWKMFEPKSKWRFQFFESANSPDLFNETMCVCGS